MFKAHSRKSEDFKTRAIFGSLFVAMIIFGFQNCGKVQKTPTVHGNQKITPMESLTGITNFSLVEQEVLKRDPDINPRDPSLNGSLINWEIDLTNSKITKREFHPEEPSSSPIFVTCDLSQDDQWNNWVETLQLLLANSQVCHYEVIQEPGTQCAAVIAAEQHSAVQNYRLGYMSSPCSSYYDICNSNNQRALYLLTLKDFIHQYSACN